MSFEYGALFDMDGVLVDNAEYHILAFEEYCREKGVTLDREEFTRTLFGKQNKDIFRVVLGVEYAPEEQAREDEYKEELYRRLYVDHVTPADGLVRFLAGLRESGFGLAVATSGPPANVEMVLDRIGADGLFDAVVTAADTSRGKPDPEVFMLAASRLGIDPARCVVFEDSVAGAQAALAAGAALIGVSTGHPSLEGAARMIDDFAAIAPDDVVDLIDSRAPAAD